ncbi:Hopanoid-associated RND transporter, HpnN, partial [hydrothermal vent metagenome]
MRSKTSRGQDAEQREDYSLLKDVLRSVTRFVSRSPKMTLWIVLLITGASVGLTAHYMDFKTSRSDLIDPNASFHQRWLKYTKEFGDSSDIVVVVEADSPDKIKEVIEHLGNRMAKESDYFTNVLYKIEPGALRSKGLQYLSPQQLEEGMQQLTQYQPIAQGRWDLIELNSLISRLDRQIQSNARNQSEKEMKPLIYHAQLLTHSMTRAIDDQNDFRSPWPSIIPVDRKMREQSQSVYYFLNDEGTLGFIKAFPAKAQEGEESFSEAAPAIKKLRELIAEETPHFPGVTIGLTGIPVLENDEMQKSQDDMIKASVISFIAVGVLLFVGFRGLRHPMLVLVMLLVGIAWAFGYTTFAVGHLNILSVSFAVVLIGLGVDFGIHYLAKYLELRREGHMLRTALMKTSGSVGTGIVTAAVTTALAFFCATFTDFLGIAELGIIAGGGILICAVVTFVVLPALIAVADKNIEPEKLPVPFKIGLLQKVTNGFPLIVMILSGVIILGIGSRAFHLTGESVQPAIQYDYNLLNLQAEGLESVETQKKVFQKSQASLLFAVSVADTAEDARRMKKEFEKLPSVDHVEELATRLPTHPPEKTRLLVQAFRAQLSRLPRKPAKLSQPNPAIVGRAMERLYQNSRRSPYRRIQRLGEMVDQFLNKFEKLSLRKQTQFLAQYQYRSSAALLGQFRAMSSASDPRPLTFKDLPKELTARYVSKEGKWLLQIHPKEQVWDVEPLTRFVKDVRSVDPDATGTPLQNYEASRQILESYQRAALYALGVIILVLLLDFLDIEHKLLALLPPLVIVIFGAMTINTRGGHVEPLYLLLGYLGMAVAIAAVLDFRNLRDAMLTMLPPIGGGLLMFGILGIFHIDLNPANLIVLPLVLGIGVDDGVHVVHNYRQQNGLYRTSSSTISAIVLTSLTSMIGFGGMMFASHRGLYSVGLVLVIGIGSCLFVSLVALPAILSYISRGQLSAEELAEEKELLKLEREAKARS